MEEGGLEQSFVYDFRNTGITPLVAGELCVVELEIQFPEPVRSGMAAFSASCLDRPGNEMVLEWSVEDGVWNRLPVFRYHKDVVVAPYSFRGIGPFGGSRYGVDLSELPAPGAAVLRIRATMVADQELGDAASIRFLGSYVNAPERADCALEVVGDPSPDPRELR